MFLNKKYFCKLFEYSFILPLDAPAPQTDVQGSASSDADDLQLFSILPDWSASCWGCVIGRYGRRETISYFVIDMHTKNEIN